MKTDFFQSCGHCWIFQICWHIKYSTLIASSFRIWNNSAGIPSPPLALFIVMFPKAHLLFFGTLHSDGYTFPFLLCLSLLFFSQLFVRPPQINIFHFCVFLLGIVLITASYTILQTSIHVLQALCLSDLIPWIYLSLPLYDYKGFDLGHTWMAWWFSLLSST